MSTADTSFPYLDTGDVYRFPPVSEATPEGILAVGGNLSPGMLISAYSQGVFPWFSEGDPILWWSPDPRCVLYPENINVSRSMKRVLRKDIFSYTLDHDFPGVIRSCARVPRPGQNGTWITEDMIEAYTILHNRGYAHSIEVWDGDRIVGGLYGISLGGMFFGESMFSLVPNSSKAAFIMLSRVLRAEGFDCLDCQLPTPHLLSLGAEGLSRREYMDILEKSMTRASVTGSWESLVPPHGLFPNSL